jgi:hypothetical protein
LVGWLYNRASPFHFLYTFIFTHCEEMYRLTVLLLFIYLKYEQYKHKQIIN